MSKEETPITAEELKRKMKYAMFQKCWEDSSLSPIMKESLKGAIDVAEQHAQSKVLEAQNNLINDIKNKVANLEENTTTTDFVFDVINLLKSIKPKRI
jgi:hypothetical protein